MTKEYTVLIEVMRKYSFSTKINCNNKKEARELVLAMDTESMDNYAAEEGRKNIFSVHEKGSTNISPFDNSN